MIALTVKDFVICHQQFTMVKEVRLDIVSKILLLTHPKRLRPSSKGGLLRGISGLVVRLVLFVVLFSAAKQMVTISSSVSSGVIVSNSPDVNKLSPELREILDFTTPYKVLVERKSWEKHDSKNKPDEIPLQTDNEQLPNNLEESPPNDRKAS